MNLWKVWTLAAKDITIFLKKRTVLLSVILFPLIVGIGLPLSVHFGAARHGLPPEAAPALRGVLNTFSFLFVMMAATLPTAIGAYSIVGEKAERSLEPLLATPTRDSEILLAKSVAAFLPTMLAIYIGAVLFMALMDKVTYASLGSLYFPNWHIGLILLVVAPLVAILSIEASVMISSRVSDVRSAQQLGGLVVLPIVAMYVAAEIGGVALNTSNLLILAGIFVVIDLLLFRLVTLTFRREEILTKWK